MAKGTYVTTYGRELDVEPVSLLLIQRLQGVVRDEFEASGKQLEPPVYCVELPTGDRQCYPHTKDTIKDPSTSDEEREAWTTYQEDMQAFNLELSERMLGAVLMDQPIDYDEGWEKKLAWLGIPIPDDEMDKKHLYLTTQVLKTRDDIEGYMMKVIEVSAGTAGEELVESAKNMFRSES